MPHAPAYPHDPIEEIAADLFMARGSVRMNALMRITRNMAIVRDRGELSLVNPIRLDEAGERALLALGEVKRILRLGPFHGLDDPYYVERFGAELWAQGRSETYPEPKIDQTLAADRPLPFPDAVLFAFEGTKQPESALLIRRDPAILLTCDAIQHYGDYRHNTLLARLVLPLIGFPKTTLVGPIWLKFMTPEGGSLKSEFERLLSLDFDRLLAAHGSLLDGGARDAVAAAVRKAFPED
ncbi:MAG: hypothetical protein JRH19_18170 [Deltaproteobacteria bacterium]|nr:hypothetical protein [Deltaproteobacteria bacterium]